MSESGPAFPGEPPPLVNHRYLAAALMAVAMMVWAVMAPSLWFLNWVHVMSGVLWTGIDLFMGFIIGPILRRVSLDTRRQIIARLMPRMLFLMPALAINTGTAGWFLAARLHFLTPGTTVFPWTVAALVMVTVLTAQGLGLLLPTNLKVYLELRKPQPDGERIGRLMRLYVKAVAFQGTLQVLIIVIMARFVTGGA
ncbi:MAG: hypothetical protein ACYDB9_08500 [Gammaproteobacteria bacterium]